MGATVIHVNSNGTRFTNREARLFNMFARWRGTPVAANHQPCGG
jgi:hypothetical protein